MVKRKNFDLWEATSAKTGRQTTLWIITIVLTILFINNVMEFWENMIENTGIVGIFSILTFFALRVILGVLFDKGGRR